MLFSPSESPSSHAYHVFLPKFYLGITFYTWFKVMPPTSMQQLDSSDAAHSCWQEYNATVPPMAPEKEVERPPRLYSARALMPRRSVNMFLGSDGIDMSESPTKPPRKMGEHALCGYDSFTCGRGIECYCPLWSWVLEWDPLFYQFRSFHHAWFLKLLSLSHFPSIAPMPFYLFVDLLGRFVLCRVRRAGIYPLHSTDLPDPG